MPVITFIEFDGTQHQVDSESGLSVMEMAMKHDIPGIDADCGGSAVCGTCHCFVETSRERSRQNNDRYHTQPSLHNQRQCRGCRAS